MTQFKKVIFYSVLLLVSLAGGLALLKMTVPSPLTVDFIDTGEARAYICNYVRKELEREGFVQGKDFAMSYTHAPNTLKDAEFLLAQSMRSKPNLIVALTPLATEVALQNEALQKSNIKLIGVGKRIKPPKSDDGKVVIIKVDNDLANDIAKKLMKYLQ